MNGVSFKLIGENNYKSNDIGYEILKNRGFGEKKIHSLLNPSPFQEVDFLLLDNAKEGVDLFLKHLKNGSKFAIVQDCDTDGLTSASQVYQYIRKYNSKIKISVIIHEKKVHGLSDTIDRCYGSDIVICPDSASSDFKYHLKLKDRGIDCLVIDHHVCEKFSENALVINNQISGISTNMSASGLVFKFLKQVDIEIGKNFVSELGLHELMCVGLVADVMRIDDIENNYFTQMSINKKYKNKLFKFILNLKKVTKIKPKDISFYIAPIINATIRAGSNSEKIELFKAISGIEADMNTLVKVKAKQDKEVTDIMKLVEDFSYVRESIVLFNIPNETAYSGLVANKIQSKYLKPALVLNKKTKKGSCRTPFSDNIDFREILKQTDMFEYCEGHKNAFGFKVNENFDIEKLNDIVSEHKLKRYYEIDFILDYSEADSWFVFDIDKISNLYSHGISEPSIIIKNVNTEIFEYKNGRINGKNNSCGVEYLKFNVSTEDYIKIKKEKSIDVLCTASVNNFFGSKMQFNISEILFSEKEMC